MNQVLPSLHGGSEINKNITHRNNDNNKGKIHNIMIKEYKLK